jgi:antitoxin component of MazEF toxin-antitoxin module
LITRVLRHEDSGNTNLKVRKIGSSYGVILPAEVLAALHVREGGTLALIPAERGAGFRFEAEDAEFAEQMRVARASCRSA